jgi:predicted NBD/HSP70 family sugar kinase
MPNIETNGHSSRRGSNQSGMRAYNERLILTLIRHDGPLSKTDISQKTGLSLQTTSVIMRKLEADGLLMKGDPIRGKVGQPSVPMSLNDTGAFFFGLKIGRRSADLILIDFVGKIVAFERLTYQFPTPRMVLQFTQDSIQSISESLSEEQRLRISGLGIAKPFELWNWASIIGIPQEEMNSWKTCDIKSELSNSFSFPVYLQNDATAACGAELTFGKVDLTLNSLYFYIGFFIGGGIVINGNHFCGSGGNAGALGSMPIPNSTGGGTRQLIDYASIASLETKIKMTGQRTDTLWNLPEINLSEWHTNNNWGIEFLTLHRWINEVSDSISYAIMASISIIDFENIVIDGWLPDEIRKTIVTEVEAKLSTQNFMGLKSPDVLEGSIGHNARALGAASLPLSERFIVSQNPFRKED